MYQPKINEKNNDQKQMESPIGKKMLCSKCGIGVYVRQDMMIIEEDSQYCAYCDDGGNDD